MMNLFKHCRIPFAAPCLALALAAALTGRASDPLPPPPEPPEPGPSFQFLVPGDLRVPVCGEKEVVVHYAAPLLTTSCREPGTVICDPPSGSRFPVGTTVVTCTAMTICGERESRTFTVTVVEDTAPPTLICPPDLPVFATHDDGVTVHYPLPEVRDDADAAVRVSYSIPSGSRFPIGRTTVTLTATDACGRTSTCSFVVTVQRAQIELARTTVQDPTGGPARSALQITPLGFEEGLEYAAAVEDEWFRAGPAPLLEDLSLAPRKFFRPPTQQGIKTAPQGEIAYVLVGLLRAYEDPGVNPQRFLADDSNAGAVLVHGGTAGGSGANRWSDPIPLPFTFHFYGRPCKQLRVSKNGLVTFADTLAGDTAGLDYFNFTQPQTTNRLNHQLPLWDRGFRIPDTIFGFAGRHLTQTAADGVWATLHGAAPKRQVWLIFRHSKDVHGRTTTAVVLEETSNRILLMDMDCGSAGNTNCWMLAGVQGALDSNREFRQVPVAPSMRLMASGSDFAGNGAYLLRPYQLNGPVAGQAAPSLMTTTNLDLTITEHLRRFNVPGMTVAISRHGRLIFNKAYGWANVQLNQPMQPHHRACIGSVSKTLAAIGVEKLIQDGLLPGLDVRANTPDRLGQDWFWAGFNEGVASGIHTNPPAFNLVNNVTIRQLLSHTAAYANINDDSGAANAYADGDYEKLTPQQQVRWFMATQPLIATNTPAAPQYSNPAFKQVGVLIEHVAGQNFEAWMLANILHPAGVQHMRLMRVSAADETWRDARRYTAYVGTRAPWVTSRSSGQIVPPAYDDARYANAADGAAGSWTGSAADLLRLLAALDGLPNHADILDPDRLNELTSVAFPSVSSSQGIGWDTVSSFNRWVRKNGDIGWGSAEIIQSRDPDRLSVAVVANTGSVNVGTLATQLVNIVRTVPEVSPFYDLFPAQQIQLAP